MLGTLSVSRGHSSSASENSRGPGDRPHRCTDRYRRADRFRDVRHAGSSKAFPRPARLFGVHYVIGDAGYVPDATGRRGASSKGTDNRHANLLKSAAQLLTDRCGSVICICRPSLFDCHRLALKTIWSSVLLACSRPRRNTRFSNQMT
jgi:hypothetical protein